VQPVHRFGTTTSWYSSCHCVLSADEAIAPQYRRQTGTRSRPYYRREV
jgi:hypothetical protein